MSQIENLTSNITPMKFKAELEMHGRVFTHIFFAHNLMELFSSIEDEFPKAKIITIIGGGY